MPSVARQRTLLLWGVSNSYEDASSLVEAYQERASKWPSILDLAPGYPRVLEGSELPGLRAGYFFVLLGVCESRQGAELAKVFQALEPRTSSRWALWDDSNGLPCPVLAEGWSLGKSTQTRARGGTLSAVSFDFVQGEGAEEQRSWLVVLQLLPREGEVVTAVIEPPEEGVHSKVKSLRGSGSEVVLVEHLLEPECGEGVPRSELHARTWRLSLKDGELTTKQTKKLLEQRTCARPEDAVGD